MRRRPTRVRFPPPPLLAQPWRSRGVPWGTIPTSGLDASRSDRRPARHASQIAVASRARSPPACRTVHARRRGAAASLCRTSAGSLSVASWYGLLGGTTGTSSTVSRGVCSRRPGTVPKAAPERLEGSDMRATLMYGAGDVRVEDVPDAGLIDSTDALVRITRAAICGSDLWPYKSMPHDEPGRRMGHEFIGVIEAVGADVETVEVGDLGGFAVSLVGRIMCLLPRGPAQLSVSMAAGTAGAMSTAGRAKRCASRRRTARWSCCRSARTTR